MTSYYFAASFVRHEEMRGYRDELLKALPDVVVTSRWIDCHDGTVTEPFTPETLATDTASCWVFGAQDLVDLAAADVVVSFTGAGTSGGRHVEYGYAIAAGKRLVIVGPRENVFHCHPAVSVYPTWEAFLKAVRDQPYAAVREQLKSKTQERTEEQE